MNSLGVTSAEEARNGLNIQNYRPVSNLWYLSKLIERNVCSRIVIEAHKSGNMEPFQSAFHEAFNRNYPTQSQNRHS